MGVRINTNLEAANAQRNLSITAGAYAKSAEKLSSGLRINRAADDAAGLSISEKLRAQTKGLNQAGRNAQDGISMIQTAEGGLNETHSILQRVRELAVQAANDTLASSDRDAIKSEMSQLSDEITRIADTTQFNGKNLLNGGLSKSTGVSNIGGGLTGLASASDVGVTPGGTTASGYYTVGVTQAATKASIGSTDTTAVAQNFTAGTAGTLVVNGESVSIAAADTAAVAMDKINAVSGKTGVTATTVAGTGANAGTTQLKLTSTAKGTAASIQISGANLDDWGLAGAGTTVVNANGKDGVVTVNDGTNTETVVGKGNVFTTTAGMKLDLTKLNVGDTGNLNITVTDGGTANLQIGANARQTLDLSINSMSASALGVTTTDLDVSSSQSINKVGGTLEKIDAAIAKVSNERSLLGAKQNRLEHTIANLAVSSENLTASESRIRDLDIAQEMVSFTKSNILQQAGTSILAQANQSGQGVLSLMR